MRRPWHWRQRSQRMHSASVSRMLEERPDRGFPPGSAAAQATASMIGQPKEVELGAPLADDEGGGDIGQSSGLVWEVLLVNPLGPGDGPVPEMQTTLILWTWKQTRDSVNQVMLARGLPLENVAVDMGAMSKRNLCYGCGKQGRFHKDYPTNPK